MGRQEAGAFCVVRESPRTRVGLAARGRRLHGPLPGNHHARPATMRAHRSELWMATFVLLIAMAAAPAPPPPARPAVRRTETCVHACLPLYRARTAA